MATKRFRDEFKVGDTVYFKRFANHSWQKGTIQRIFKGWTGALVATVMRDDAKEDDFYKTEEVHFRRANITTEAEFLANIQPAVLEQEARLAESVERRRQETIARYREFSKFLIDYVHNADPMTDTLARTLILNGIPEPKLLTELQAERDQRQIEGDAAGDRYVFNPAQHEIDRRVGRADELFPVEEVQE